MSRHNRERRRQRRQQATPDSHRIPVKWARQYFRLSAEAQRVALMLLELAGNSGLNNFTTTAGGPDMDPAMQELQFAGLIDYRPVVNGDESDGEKSYAVTLHM